jgi:hypothetical protein
MRRFLRPFRPVLDPVFECFSFFFTQKNSRFLLFFAIFLAKTQPYFAKTQPYFTKTLPYFIKTLP